MLYRIIKTTMENNFLKLTCIPLNAIWLLIKRLNDLNAIWLLRRQLNPLNAIWFLMRLLNPLNSIWLLIRLFNPLNTNSLFIRLLNLSNTNLTFYKTKMVRKCCNRYFIHRKFALSFLQRFTIRGRSSVLTMWDIW